MEVYKNPLPEDWQRLISRPSFDVTELFDTVRNIIEDVRHNGDAALIKYERLFDKADLSGLSVSEAEVAAAEQAVSSALKAAMQQAAENIRTFHAAQRFQPIEVETCPGVWCRQTAVPIERVGLYIPGGTAPLFSTVLMLAIPAQIAGCSEVILCTPPRKDGTIHPAVLSAARLCGVSRVFKVGGAQAIAAMAVGTESIPKVDKIFGPGNQYVTAAKQWASLSGVAIDMPAGPSEVEVLADATCEPGFVAADLLSQAEHGRDSQAVLVTTSEDVARRVQAETSRQLEALSRREIAETSLKNSRIVVFDKMEDAIAFTNSYAPEHLIIATENYRAVAEKIIHAGSVFLGNYSCESAGDYASGTNHTLPTSGYARSYSGLSLDSFVRKMTFQELTPVGIRNIGPAVETMAAAEQLDGHKAAMSIRLNSLK